MYVLHTVQSYSVYTEHTPSTVSTANKDSQVIDTDPFTSVDILESILEPNMLGLIFLPSTSLLISLRHNVIPPHTSMLLREEAVTSCMQI
jgi:hypothetical protein